jgi:hypothetical protein
MPHTRNISNADDIIDSRDVIARIAELENEKEVLDSNYADALTEARETDTRDPDPSEYMLDEDDAAELAALKALADEASGSPDWTYGETLIADHYFIEYAQQLAEDIGAIGRDLAWPACHIDWDAAADALKADYTSVDFAGETYWIRS